MSVGISRDNRNKFFLVIICTGMLLPWLTGIAVKLYRQAQGKPTLPWSYFINLPTLLMAIPYTLWLGSPYIGFAFIARYILGKPAILNLSHTKLFIILLVGYMGGVMGSIITFVGVFREFDPLLLLLPLPLAYASSIVLGVFVGVVMVGAGSLIQRKRSDPEV
jgi:hypothetical protein